VQAFGDKIAVGIDAKVGQVAVKGWVDTTGTTALALARRMDALGVATLIHTDVGTDGMLTGPNLAAQEAMCRAVRCRVIASGGVSRREDVQALVALARRQANLDGVIVGKALYERRVELADLLRLTALDRSDAVKPVPRMKTRTLKGCSRHRRTEPRQGDNLTRRRLAGETAGFGDPALHLRQRRSGAGWIFPTNGRAAPGRKTRRSGPRPGAGDRDFLRHKMQRQQNGEQRLQAAGVGFLTQRPRHELIQVRAFQQQRLGLGESEHLAEDIEIGRRPGPQPVKRAIVLRHRGGGVVRGKIEQARAETRDEAPVKPVR